MSNELAKLTDALPPVPYDQSLLEKALQSGAYYPRVQLMTAKSEVVAKGEFPLNHFALIRDQAHMDLGSEVDALVLSYRPKAMDFSNEDELIISYDPDSSDWQEIKNKADTDPVGCMYGVEILLWLPDQKCFATLYCGTKTLRREAQNIIAMRGQWITLKPKNISTKKYTWTGILTVACSAEYEVPDKDTLIQEIEKFNNPETETTDSETSTPDRER